MSKRRARQQTVQQEPAPSDEQQQALESRDSAVDEQEMNALQDAAVDGVEQAARAATNITEDFIASIKVQEEILRQDLPELDLATEMEQYPLFAMMLAYGENLFDVYGYFHPEFTEKRMEENVMSRIQKRNMRPKSIKSRPEASSVNVENLSDEEMAEIDRRVRRGEKVTF